MANPHSNNVVHDVLEEQHRRIEEEKMNCAEKYGNGIFNTTLRRIVDFNQGFSCPATWDGITCWSPVPAGTTASKACSSLSYISGFVLNNTATKTCLESGDWFMREGGYWTNFSQCHIENKTTIFVTHPNITNGTSLEREYLSLLKGIKKTGYLLSLITLLVALFIMITIKKLHCSRNILHIHLFTSFILRAFIFLLKEVTFVDGIGLPSDILGVQNGSFFNIELETNNWQCKSLTSLWQYFNTANYSWILMEGLYLYNLIFRALFADSSGSVMGYIIMGWAAWILGRIFLDDNLCWTMNNYKTYLIIEIPTLLSVVINLIFFVRISLVLLNKLISPLNDDNRRCYMKWAKSTLVLVPLFGVNYVVLFGFQYISNEVVNLVWYACDSLFGSFQGFFVAVLYCFMNGEVKAEVKPILREILPFLATHKIFKLCFPCREKFLGSTRGKISVCTTLSCSSMYANGLINSRGNIARNRDHYCQHMRRMSHDIGTCESTRTSINFSNSRKQSLLYRSGNNDEAMEMSNLFQPEMKRVQED
ncbi:vasoactive intestinal polypeptide receptor 1-like isoform X2 [Coccinella septempunctata]|uniref:vasoactive intestinal polypeptide receptor 1-like isoform X2 n=1 Tax=Coccinella septempunctata TaxID=41139 RepID=UPI001D08A8EA|nr:vasoactive intestinal polypeptide receptor 1-like isoform X2 [Coccinella septempunctata]